MKGLWNRGKTRAQYSRRYHFFPILEGVGFGTSLCGFEYDPKREDVRSEPYHACLRCLAYKTTAEEDILVSVVKVRP